MAPLGKESSRLVMILLLVELTSLGLQAAEDMRCNDQSYDPNDAYAKHVTDVKVDLLNVTPTRHDQGYDYYTHSGGSDPTAYGHANCSTSLTPGDCQWCIYRALKNMSIYCGLSMGAEVMLDDCDARYEAYPFTA